MIPDGLVSALAGRYTIERELGRGGMATVYLAQDLRHGRAVALKVLDPQLAHALGPERFRREIEIAARLQHPHILTVFDSGGVDEILWYTMPFVEGETLRDRLTRERALDIPAALHLLGEIADGLDYAHGQGVIHRDIKPENILLSRGHALITDFGIARAIHGDRGRLTSTGLAIGTPAYMSPEQAAGDREVEAASDVYSLAAVGFEMVTGEPPYSGPTALAILTKRVAGPVPSPRRFRPAVPVNADRAIIRALSPAPADRFPSAGAFVTALREGTTGARRTWPRWAGAGIAVAAVSVAAFLIVRSTPGPIPGIGSHLARGNQLLAARTPEAAGQAIAEYEAVLAREPANPIALAKIGYTYALFNEWGWAYQRLSSADLHARAIDYSQRALAADSLSGEAWLTRAYLLSADDPYRMKGAVEAFTRALAIDSTSAEGWYQFGQVLMALGQDDRAIGAYRRAFALDHNRPLVLMSLAAILWQSGRLPEARRVVDSAVTASRTATSPYVRVIRGLIELDGGDVRAAHDDADLALAMDSNYTIPARTLLVKVYLAEGDRTRAGAELARLLKDLGSADPSPTNARFAASALIAIGRTRDAVTMIERARPRGAYLWFYLHAADFRALHADPRFELVYRQADPNGPGS